MADKILAALQEAAEGVLYPSETDAPFEAFVWDEPKNTAAAVRRGAGLSASARCEQLAPDDFFADLTGDEEFRALRAALDRVLSDAKVYKFGKIEVTYFIVGTTTDGRLAGLKTRAVET